MDFCSDVGLFGLSASARKLAFDMLGRGVRLSVLAGAAGDPGFAGPVDAADGSPSRSDALGGLAAALGDHALDGAARPFFAPNAEELLAGLSRPRRVILASAPDGPADAYVTRIASLLDKGDILVDCLDDAWRDSGRKASICSERGIRYLELAFIGESGGSESGLSMLASGDEEAWQAIGPTFSDAAARTVDGSPCAAFLGPAGASRFVRMVHNSLAGADAEFVAETYHLLRASLRMSHDEMRMVFSDWNRTELASYLIGITADVLGVRDEDGEALVEKVLDSAGQDLAGLQAAEAALELGCPAGLFSDAAFARNLSTLKDERVGASAVLGGAKAAATGERQAMVEDLRRALLAARIIGYSEGFTLLRWASEAYGWSLDLGRIALAWREGCFVSASILDSIAEAYKRENGLASLLLDSRLKSTLDASLPALRKTVARAIEQGIPVPGFSSAISFFDGYRSTWLPASLIAAIKDRAASSGYERIDRPRGESFHSDWK